MGVTNAQSLILQTIWCLEDAFVTHEKVKKRNLRASNCPITQRDDTSIRQNIRHALKGLTELHILLYGYRPYDQDDILPPYSFSLEEMEPIKALASLRLPFLDKSESLARRLRLRSSLSFYQLHLNADKPPVNNSEHARTPKTRRSKTNVASTAEFRSPNHAKDISEGHSSAITDETQNHSQSPESRVELQLLVSLEDKKAFAQALKLVRQYFERSHSFPSPVIRSLDAYERMFSLDRDQTTNSIWNVDHQELRTEVFGDTDAGNWYRQKCVCVKDSLHSLDVYCPRNLPLETSGSDEELEWDEELQDLRKKIPPSPAESDTASDNEEEADEEAERIANEKALAESREYALSEINAMVGLANFKEHLKKVAARVETSTRQGVNLKEERWGTVLIGKSGTGKTTMARNYAKYLSASGLVGPGFKETSGVYLSDGGISRTKNYINELSPSGGVLFVDDAHCILSYSGGRKVMDFMIQEMENQRGKVVFVMAGHEKGMIKVLGHGNGTTELLPYVFNLKDYSDPEILEIMGSYVTKKYDGKMQVEGGLDGLYMRVAARRVARDRDTPHFGNARAVENMLSRICDRQSARLSKLREEKEASAASKRHIAEVDVPQTKSEDLEDEPKGERDVPNMELEMKVSSNAMEAAPMADADGEPTKTGENGTTTIAAGRSAHTEEKELNSQPAKDTLTEIVLPDQTRLANLSEGSSTEQQISKPEDKDTDSGLKICSETEVGKSAIEVFATGSETAKPENDSSTPCSMLRSASEKVDPEIPQDIHTPKSESKPDVDLAISKESEALVQEETVKKNEEIEETKSEVDPADYMFTKEDILGSDPSEAILDSAAWKQIQGLTGLEAVKRSILNLFEVVKSNYQRELAEKPLLKLSLNRLFLGPPGTGKTVVAKLYAQLLVDIGALSKGEVIIKNPSDLIGQYIGHSEANTAAALTAARGNVLVIDEAHMMYTGSSDGTGNKSDCFRQAIIDTIVAEVQSVPGEDRAVLLLGYEDKMQEMLRNTNPGLSRRFPIADAFWFKDFTRPELESILKSKLEEHVLEATPEAIKVAMDVLDKSSSRLNFGNGGEVENLISKAKTNHQGRISLLQSSDRPEKWIFEPQDFDPEFDRGKSATANLQKLFCDVVGCDDIVKKLDGYQRVTQTLKLRNRDPKAYIPMNFVLKGPPGTGKTTTARKIAQVYFDMGFLAEPAVVECSASDLVGKYIGHTGPKTTKVLEKALGKVLFIDEAYRLAVGGDSSFTTEAVSELVDQLTKPCFHGNLIVILAGYENEMNNLLAVNPGLASRFPNEIHFTCLSPTHSLEVLNMKLAEAGIEVPVLAQQKTMDYKNLLRLMGLLAATPLWGNARDVETLAKSLTMLVLGGPIDDGELSCSASIITGAMEAMLEERRARNNQQVQHGFYI